MFGELVVPSDIDTLKDVHKQKESDEDGGEIPVDELDEDDGPFHEIEGFRHVHHAAEDIIIILDEVIDSLDYNPGTHEC